MTSVWPALAVSMGSARLSEGGEGREREEVVTVSAAITVGRRRLGVHRCPLHVVQLQ